MSKAGLLPLVFVLFCFALPLPAASLQAELVDSAGQPLAHAVLTLQGPLEGVSALSAEVMDQRAQQFVPHVLAVRTGTAVSFPNGDDIRHHVYSFSPAKRFELRLYKGTPSEPVLFDTPGVVVLGCNIHDWMVGYVYVTDDPWFAVSDEQGRVQLDGLSPGRYQITLWHPQLDGLMSQPGGELQLGATGIRQRFALAVQPLAPAPGRAPRSAFGDAFKSARDAAQ
jgi:plastocyanin